METHANGSRLVRFGLFVADLSAQQLFKNSSPIRLQEKPFQLLAILIERSGHTVTREELRQRLWQSDTFVEFDEGVNAAVGKLRYALGDSSENPIFVQTVRGQGYRWIAPLEWTPSRDLSNESLLPAGPTTASGQLQSNPPTTVNLPATRRTDKLILVISAATILSLAFAAYVIESNFKPHPVLPLKEKQLTSNSTDNPVSSSSASPDGKYLAYADLKGLHLKLLTTGEVRDIPNPEPYKNEYVEWGMAQNWLPDGTQFLVNTNLPYQPVSTWVVSVLGTPPRKLRDELGPWSVSPVDGAFTYTTNPGRVGDREIGITNPDGSGFHKLIETGDDSAFSVLVWSPDGRRIAYIKDDTHSGTDQVSIGAVDVTTHSAVTLLDGSDLKGMSDLSTDLRNLVWLPDGRLIYSLATQDANGISCNFWQLQLDKDSGQPIARPKQITNWSGFCVLIAGAIAGGKELVFQKITGYLSVWVADFDARTDRISPPKRLTDQQTQQFPAAWSADSRTIFFASQHDGRWSILKQHPEEEQADTIVSGLPIVADQAPLTPDGSALLNISTSPNSSGLTLSRISTSDGKQEPLLQGATNGVRCARPAAHLCAIADETPNHKQLIFTQLDFEARKRGPEIARFTYESGQTNYEWGLSPDGKTIAVSQQSSAKISLISLANQSVRTIEVKGYAYVSNFTWRTDGLGFYASHPSKKGAVLLTIDLAGKAQVLWEVPGQHIYLRALPSPDNHRLAILSSVSDNNVWSLENF